MQVNSRRFSAAAQIQQARLSGEITINEWATYECYALFDPSKIPSRYRTSTPEKCGTWIIDEIHSRWGNLNEKTKSILQKYRFTSSGSFPRPTGLDSVRSTDHFLIHYSIESGDTNAISTFDGDGNLTPDYIDTVMALMEQVHDSEIVSMGYFLPPGDGSEGGDALYDVYIYKIGAFALGFMAQENSVGDNPNSPARIEAYAWTSWLALANDYGGYPGDPGINREVTIAHEFFHAIQFGYNGEAKEWMKEATATWCEDEVFDNDNENIAYLASWFQYPEYSLNSDPYSTGPGSWYGAWIFFRYVSEHVGGRNTVRQIWDASVPYNSTESNEGFNAIGGALAAHGTNFTNVFRNFTAANYLGTVPPFFNYEEGDAYPRIFPHVLAENLVIFDTVSSRASRYFQVEPSRIFSPDEALTITFTSLDALTPFGIQLLTKSGGQYTRQIFQNSVALTSVSLLDDIVVIVMNFDSGGSTHAFRLAIGTGVKFSKEAPAVASPGENITYRVNFGNGSPDTINNVVIRDVLPDNFQFISASTGGGLVGDTIVWNIGTLEPGDTGRFVTFNGKNHSLCFLVNDHYTLSGDALPTITGPPTITASIPPVLGGPVDAIVTDLGYFRPKGLNDSTHVLGDYLIWKDCATIPLTPPPGFAFATAFDINDSGEVVGEMETIGPRRYVGFIYSKGNLTELDPGIPENYLATAINNKREVVGDVFSSLSNRIGSHLYAYLFKEGGLTQITHPDPIWRYPVPSHISDASEVVGGLYGTNGSGLAFSWQGGSFTFLPDYCGKTLNDFSVANRINVLGQIIGLSYDTLLNVPAQDETTYVIRPAFWGSSGSYPLNPALDYANPLASAQDINNRGEVVGRYQTSFLSASHAFIWSLTDGFRDLNDVIPSGTGWVLTEASALNNKGQIAGQGIYRGYIHAFLYTPAGGPTSVPNDNSGENVPRTFSLSQNYPNPFNPLTVIRYSLPVRSRVSIGVFNVLGQEVATLINGSEEAGFKTVKWDANNFPSGVYFYRIVAGEFVETKKLLLMK